MDDDAGTRASLSAIGTRFSSGPFTLFLNLVCYKILFLQMEGMPISPHEIYFSSISTFLNFLILKCQGMEKTPFDTHPKTMSAAIISFFLLVYSIRLEAEAGFYSASNGLRVVSHFVCLFWSFTLASLVSLLLPDSIRPILYVLCLVPWIFGLLHSFYGRIWRKFEEWLNVQRIRIVRFLISKTHLMARICRNQRGIGRLPV